MTGWLAILVWLRRGIRGLIFTAFGLGVAGGSWIESGDHSWWVRAASSLVGVAISLYGIKLLRIAEEDFRDRYS